MKNLVKGLRRCVCVWGGGGGETVMGGQEKGASD